MRKIFRLSTNIPYTYVALTERKKNNYFNSCEISSHQQYFFFIVEFTAGDIDLMQ